MTPQDFNPAIPLQQIKVSKTNPRKRFDQVALDELARSIKSRGVDTPISVRMTEDGGIVGITTIIDCVKNHESPWKDEGSIGFVLRDSRPVQFVPCKGMLGFFKVDP
jgi:ParB-like nuclease domain